LHFRAALPRARGGACRHSTTWFAMARIEQKIAEKDCKLEEEAKGDRNPLTIACLKAKIAELKLEYKVESYARSNKGAKSSLCPPSSSANLLSPPLPLAQSSVQISSPFRFSFRYYHSGRLLRHFSPGSEKIH
jgi:hypothetical protein